MATMIKRNILTLAAVWLAFVPALVLGQENNNQLDTLQKRADYDAHKIYVRKRKAHACIMSIVFLVLYPMGAISIHLPINRISFLKNTYLRNKVPAIHAPIQWIGFVMMIGGMALGIRIAHDLGYLSGPNHAHIIVGLLVTSIIILVQPAMGILQHLHFKKTGRKSTFGYIHRWVGRSAIMLGIINAGLGFELARNTDIDVSAGTYVKNFAILAVLAVVYLALLSYDTFKAPPSAGNNGGRRDRMDDEARLVDRKFIELR